MNQRPERPDKIQVDERRAQMASKTKKTEARRKWKDKPNKENLRKDRKRLARNQERLKDLAGRDASA